MTKRRKIIITTIIVAALAAAGIASYVYAQRTNDRAETTSKSPTAQSDYSDGDDRPSNAGSGAAQGGAVDTGGRDDTPVASPIVSDTGDLTVSQPAASAQLASGVVLSGTAKGIAQVQYRLIDDEVGVLAQGALTVKDGSYSGKLQFEARAKTGRLDVFSFNAAGEEINTIEIPVTLK